jgi:hypothetical protein
MPVEISDSNTTRFNNASDFGEYLVRRNLELLMVNPVTGLPDPFGTRVG